MQISVLLVDDHAIFRKGISLLLESAGDFCVVGEASDGDSAVELARERRPDVIVMDIGLPNTNGIEATRQILAENTDIKVLALSIHGEKHFVDNMLEAGASGYILKESAPEELMEGIRTVMGGGTYLSKAIKELVLSGLVDYLSREKNLHNPHDAVDSTPLLTTKMFPPPVSERIIFRRRLIQQLEVDRWRPLTLVSAPAGYGKSTLVSQWLQAVEGETPGAWLSLDENDNDLRKFLHYFIGAVRTLFPDALENTLSYILAPSLPTTKILSRTLINELDNLPRRFILVLDDYHYIDEPAVHELLVEFLQYPPQTTHLVVVSRTDPPLDLLEWLARQKMAVLRAPELSFITEETLDLLHNITGAEVGEHLAQELTTHTEGWITGLYLMTLSVSDRAGLDNLLNILPDNRQPLDYLAAETLAHQPREIQAWLLKTSILDRFCAPLCQAVCIPPLGKDIPSYGGAGFIRWLVESNLFIIPLDHQRHWFRYHHLFRNLLRNQLRFVLDDDEIATLHAQASRWFLENGEMGEAIEHALEAGDAQMAAGIINEHRHIEHEAGRWRRVENWLARLPAELKDNQPGLLLAQAWIEFTHFRLERVPPLIEKVGALLDEESTAPQLLGELNFFRGNLLYWGGETEASVRCLETASSQIAGREAHVDGNNEVMLGLARHMHGKKQAAILALTDRIRKATPDESFLRAYLFAALAFIHMLSGEIAQVRKRTISMENEPSIVSSSNTQAWGWYLNGCAHLHAYELEEAASSLRLAARQRYTLDTGAVVDAMAGLALAQGLMGRADQATEALDDLLELARELDAPGPLAAAQSTLARISLLVGDLAPAVQWAQADQPTPAPASLFLWLEVPALTQARVWVAEGSEAGLEKAIEALREIREQSQTHFFTNQVIEAAVLETLTLEKLGRVDEAARTLQGALNLAAPGGWVRPFVELGPPMAELLKRQMGKEISGDLRNTISLILAAFPTAASPHPSINSPALVEPLSERELQVLRLLASALTTDEIADELSLSIHTVRAHTKKIYNKIGAHSRIEAVESGRDLGLI